MAFHYLQVLGEKGMVSLSNVPEEPVMVFEDSGCLNSKFQRDTCQRYQEAYRQELDHFVAVMLGKEELLVTEKETLGAMQVVDACIRSFHSQRMERVCY